MRIAIDLCACQQADTPLARASLAVVRYMLAEPAGHTLWLAFDGRFPLRIEGLRAAFAGLLPAERMQVYALPALDAMGGMDELIKEHFFASRGIELVFHPGAAAAATAPPPSPHFLRVNGVAPGTAYAQDALMVELGADPAQGAQQAWRTFALAASRRLPPALPGTRPALAWIAAQAPAPAHARLLAALARCYDLALILPAAEAVDAGLPYMVRSVDWFARHAAGFRRVVYGMGNSPRHGFMRALLARHPGIVYLHDFYLGAQLAGEPDPAWRKTLFDAHGFTGLATAGAIGRAAAADAYPLNKDVLDLATGVIAGADAFLTEAQDWYGPDAAGDWRCLFIEGEDGAAACLDAIEAFTQRSPAAHYRALIEAVRALGFPRDARHPPLLAAARAIAANAQPTAPRQLLVDVSAMVQLDARTGISRVVRSILLALIASPPPGYRVEAVYGDGGNRPYRYARAFTLGLIGAAGMALEDAPIEQRAGDIFVGVDVAASITNQNAALFAGMRNRGVQVFFVVHDILPVLMPAMFAYGTDTYFRKYLETIARHADGLLCTTRAGADTLADWLTAHPAAHAAPRPDPLRIGYFHLGADLAASAPSTGLAPDAAAIRAAASGCPTLLMVGTLEPRKAQAQALAAFELLWARQVAVNLVIVGKPGWMVEPLIRKLKAHPQLGARLFWLAEASDEMLASLYGACSGLLAPSLGEGFGLPLIEAAQYGLPIVARKLPVFEEICGAHAFYFEGGTAPELAAALEAWLALLASGQAPASRGLPWLSWAESARRLCDCVVNQHWYRSVPGTATL